MNGMADVIRELVVRISVNTAGTSAGFSVIEDRLQNIRQIMMGIKDVGVFLARTVFTFGKAGANLESMEIKFGTLARSMELGKEKLEELNQFATETPFTLPEVRKNTSMLMAMGVSLKDIIPVMTKLGNVTAGLPNMSLERLALNFGQVMSQGHLTGRELRDFAVGGVPIMESLRDITGKTDQQLRDMMKNKQISFDMVNKAFDYMVSKEGRFHKLLDKMAESSEGLYNNIKVTWDLIKEGIGKEVLKDLKPLLKEFKDFLSNNREKIIKEIKGTIIGLSNVLVVLYKIVYRIGKAMLPVVSVIAEMLVGIMKFYGAIIMFITSSPKFIAALKIAIFLLASFVAGFVVRNLILFSQGISTVSMALMQLSPALGKAALSMGLFSKTWYKSLWTMIKAAAPFLAVGALVLGIFLVLEDMYVYLIGLTEGIETESYTGDIINALTKGNKVLKKQLDDLVKILVTPFAGITALLELSWLKIVGTDEEFDKALSKHSNRLNQIKDAFLEVDFEGTMQTVFGGIADKIFGWSYPFFDELNKLDEKLTHTVFSWMDRTAAASETYWEKLKKQLRRFDLEFGQMWNDLWYGKKINYDRFFKSIKDIFLRLYDDITALIKKLFPDFLLEKLGFKLEKPKILEDAMEKVKELTDKAPQQSSVVETFVKETEQRQSITEPKNVAVAPTTTNVSYDQSKKQVNYNQQSYTINTTNGEDARKFLEEQQSQIKQDELDFSGGN